MTAEEFNKKKEESRKSKRKTEFRFSHIYCEKCGEMFLICAPEYYKFFSLFKDREYIEFSNEIPLYENEVQKNVFPGLAKNWGGFLQELYYDNGRIMSDIRNESKLDYTNVPSEEVWWCANISDLKTSKLRKLSTATSSSDRYMYKVSFKISPSEDMHEYGPFKRKEKMLCPCCGSVLDFENTRFNKTSRDRKLAEEERDIILAGIDSSVIHNSFLPKETIDVAEYLNNLTKIETSIRYYTDMLFLLIQKRLICRRSDYKIQITSEMDVREKLSNELKNIETKIRSLQDGYTPTSEELKKEMERNGVLIPIEPNQPNKPDSFDEICPQQPEIKTPGLFNRAKIKQQNEQALSEYEDRLKEYNMHLEKYNSSVEQYERDMQKYSIDRSEYNKQCAYYDSEKRRICDEMIERNREIQQSQIDELMREKNLVSQRLKDIGQEVSQYVANSIVHQLTVFYNTEVSEIEDRIKELKQCEADLLSMDIIYPKYLDYIALLTICEYFETGRVSELKGPNGAYNLYESELRQNIIIAQMDIVIQQLEQIKQNQYMLYQELNSINSGISKMTDKLDDISSSIESIDTTSKESLKALSAIDKNTAVTAYYAEKTAQNTKRQNDLTKALGFLVAFK